MQHIVVEEVAIEAVVLAPEVKEDETASRSKNCVVKIPVFAVHGNSTNKRV